MHKDINMDDAMKKIEEIKEGQSELSSSSDRDGKERRKTQAIKLIELVTEDKEVTLFHDNLRVAYARVPINSYFALWPCRSQSFKSWLLQKYYSEFSSPPNSDALNTAISTLEAKARFEGDEYRLHNRLAWYNNAIWYDLTDKYSRAIEITADGWRIVDHPPILFHRLSHQRPQVEPQTEAGNVKTVLRFLNLSNQEQQLLFLVLLISSFIPGEFAHPIPILYGAQGSAKSTLCKIFKKLVDPSAIEVTSVPHSHNELVQLVAHHWLTFFDNISHLSDSASDLLCKVVTGGGFSKRELYTNDDDVVYELRRCLGINGVNLVVRKPDLMDRSILFELERVPTANRRTEKELWSEFEEQRPLILGGIFDILSQSLKIKPNIKLSTLPRMADFAEWGCAITQALNWSQHDFLKFYSSNIASQHQYVIGDSLEASALMAFMDQRAHWEGSASQLLEELKTAGQTAGINTNDPNFPKAANTLSKRFNELKTNLEDMGIKFSKGQKGKQRVILLQKVIPNTVDIVESPPNLRPGSLREVNEGDIGNGISQISSPPSSYPLDQTIGKYDAENDADGELGNLLGDKYDSNAAYMERLLENHSLSDPSIK